MIKLAEIQAAANVRLSNREADRKRHAARPKMQGRGGINYRALQEAPGGLLDKLADGILTIEEGVDILNALYPDYKKKFTAGGVRRAVNKRRNEMGKEALVGEWEISDQDALMFGSDLDEKMAKAIASNDKGAIDAILDDLTERFVKWRRTFILSGNGRPRYINQQKGSGGSLNTYTWGRELGTTPPEP